MFFFFNDTATTEIYTLSLHDALPILRNVDFPHVADVHVLQSGGETVYHAIDSQDRKSTRLNSSHANISYAVFCLKKKKKSTTTFYYPTKINLKNSIIIQTINNISYVS